MTRGEDRRHRWRGRARLVEALALLTAASAARSWLPMPRWSGVLGATVPVPPGWVGRPVEALPLAVATPVELRVVTAIRRGCELLPRTPSCLAEAAAAQVMLAWRGQPGVVVVGLRRVPGTGAWDAHAWLLGRGGALTGGAAAEGFSPTAAFERPGGLRADDVVLSPTSG